MSNPNPQTIAAANALSGERTHQTVSFPITGDPETDAISAVSVVLGQVFDVNYIRGFVELIRQKKAMVRVLKYLIERYEAEAASMQNENDNSLEQYRVKMGHIVAPITPWTTGTGYVAGGNTQFPCNGLHDAPPTDFEARLLEARAKWDAARKSAHHDEIMRQIGTGQQRPDNP